MSTPGMQNWTMWADGRKTTISDLIGLKSVDIIFNDGERISLLNICHRRYRTFAACTSVKILGLMASPWRIICPPASTSAMSSASARSPSMPWNCCVVMAWVTTRWGTSTRLSSSLSYRTPHRHGGVRPIISVADKQRLKAITTCYIRLGSTQLTILRRPNSLLTYYGRQCFVMFCINYTTSKQHWTYNLRHIIGVTLCH